VGWRLKGREALGAAKSAKSNQEQLRAINSNQEQSRAIKSSQERRRDALRCLFSVRVGGAERHAKEFGAWDRRSPFADS
jgi:hypothetical protein